MEIHLGCILQLYATIVHNKYIAYATVTIDCFLLSQLHAKAAKPNLQTDTNLSSCLKKANGLLDEAFVFMQRNYYRKNSVEWDSLKISAKRKLISSGDCNETYDIITSCFRELNETHSFIMPPSKAAVYNYDTATLQKNHRLLNW